MLSCATGEVGHDGDEFARANGLWQMYLKASLKHSDAIFFAHVSRQCGRGRKTLMSGGETDPEGRSPLGYDPDNVAFRYW